jgi:hypothetical protein
MRSGARDVIVMLAITGCSMLLVSACLVVALGITLALMVLLGV